MIKIFSKLSFAVILAVLALPVSAAFEIVPCAVGNKWEYSSVNVLRATISHQGRPLATMDKASSGSAIYEITSVDSTGSQPIYEYVETSTMQQVDGTEDTNKTTLMITSDKDALRILSEYKEHSQEDTPEKQNYDPPLFYYNKAVAAGMSWDVGTIISGDAKTPMAARFGEKETVTVPAGTFKDCLKVIYTSDEIIGSVDIMNKPFTFTSGRSRGIYWVADGVGVVKELEVSTATAETPGPDGKMVTMEMASCTVSELKPGYVVK